MDCCQVLLRLAPETTEAKAEVEPVVVPPRALLDAVAQDDAEDSEGQDRRKMSQGVTRCSWKLIRYLTQRISHRKLIIYRTPQLELPEGGWLFSFKECIRLSESRRTVTTSLPIRHEKCVFSMAATG